MSVKEVIGSTPLYLPVRNVYRAIFNRKWAAEYRRMRQFYSQFFDRGDLVFDIGANVGEYSDLFASAGAKVVAVEPNPKCCGALYTIARIRNVRVERCAVGSSVGSCILNVCSESYFSTLNSQWLAETKRSPIYKDVQWKDSIEVPIVTLDSLAKAHGIPSFVKIDVEGYEFEALSGMSFRPDYLSFEFSRSIKDVAMRCMDLLKDCKFNFILARNFTFTERWMEHRTAKEWLNAYSGPTEYGDIFACFRT